MNVFGSILVLAVEEGEAEAELQLLPEFAEMVWGFISFVILFAILYKLVWPRLSAMLDERAASIQGRLEEAESLRDEAEELRRRYEAQLAEARATANDIVEDARSQGERRREEIVTAAERDAEQIRAQAREDAEAERGRLVQELRGQLAVLSVELAGKIVQRELDADRHRSLVDQYINELSGLR